MWMYHFLYSYFYLYKGTQEEVGAPGKFTSYLFTDGTKEPTGKDFIRWKGQRMSKACYKDGGLGVTGRQFYIDHRFCFSNSSPTQPAGNTA